MFCIYPELIVSRLFTEVMQDNEVFTYIDCIQGAHISLVLYHYRSREVFLVQWLFRFFSV